MPDTTAQGKGTAPSEDDEGQRFGMEEFGRALDGWRSKIDELMVQIDLGNLDMRDEIRRRLDTTQNIYLAARSRLSDARRDTNANVSALRSTVDELLGDLNAAYEPWRQWSVAVASRANADQASSPRSPPTANQQGLRRGRYLVLSLVTLRWTPGRQEGDPGPVALLPGGDDSQRPARASVRSLSLVPLGTFGSAEPTKGSSHWSHDHHHRCCRHHRHRGAVGPVCADRQAVRGGRPVPIGSSGGTRDPGLHLIIPIIDNLRRVSLRIVTMPIQSQGIITRDNVSVDVSAVAYFRVVDAVKSVVAIESVGAAIDQIAQTTLRKVVGQHTLDETLSETDRINLDIRQILDQTTTDWGVEVTLVELKDIQLPDSMKRAMARQAEAEREKRAKIINAEGESLAAAALGDASDTMMAHPLALQLRNLQSLVEIAVDKNSTVVFPAPLMSTIAELGTFLAQETAASKVTTVAVGDRPPLRVAGAADAVRPRSAT